MYKRQVTALGTWNKGVIPGIHSTETVADDVFDENLEILLENKVEDDNFYSAAFLNAKGFGGNNASATILSPLESKSLLTQRYSKNKMASYESKANETRQKSSQHNKQSLKGNYNVVYKFNENVLHGETDVKIERGKIKLKNFKNPINLKGKSYGKKLARS